jgi:hypothetical protein
MGRDMGHWSRRCSTVSALLPHAGHLALLTLPIRLRYWFTGACAILSCDMWLESLQLSSLWLIIFRNFFDSITSLNQASLLPLSKVFHHVFQMAFSMLWCALLIAAGLIGNGFLARGGRRCFSDEYPSAALLASLSTSSFPAMPLCPAV